MIKFNPFCNVSTQYGAPMGRISDNPANLQDEPVLFAEHQGGGGGYDKGGVYWGLPDNVFAVWCKYDDGDVSVTYVRASSCADAISKVRCTD